MPLGPHPLHGSGGDGDPPPHGPPQLPPPHDGQVVKEASDPRTYVVYGGAKFLIAGPDELAALGFTPAQVVTYPNGALQHLGAAPMDFTVLRERLSATPYVFFSGSKLAVPTPATMSAMGLDPNAVHVVPNGSLAALPEIKTESAAATPASLYFANNAATYKWSPVFLPTSRRVVSRGIPVSLTELRGWLCAVMGGPNTADPDWDYSLLIDPEWCDQVGIDLHAITRVGDILQGVPNDPARSPYAVVSSPRINIELNGWPPKRPVATGWPKPDDWKWSTATPEGTIFFPYDPLNPSSPLRVTGDNYPLDPFGAPGDPGTAPYVRVLGSLVSDEPHYNIGVIAVAIARVYGWAYSHDTAERAAKLTWDGSDASNPAQLGRSTEIHPPDNFIVMAHDPPQSTFRGVAVVAGSGFISGSTTLDFDIVPPGPQPPGMRATVNENVGSETLYHTIVEGNADLTGARIDLEDTFARVHIKVQAQNFYGSAGKFKALYRCFWSPR